MSSPKAQHLFSKFNTRETGLTNKEADERLIEHGPNKITVKKRKPLWLAFVEEFKDLMVIILIIAALISGLAGEFSDSIVILVVVLINAFIGFIQKFKAEKAIEALQKLVSPLARVIRSGKDQQIQAENLVPGDVLLINEGDKVTADAILIEQHEVQISEAIMTGESMPVPKKSIYEIKSDKDLVSANIWMGTLVNHGTGIAIVSATGMKTEFGKIAELTVTTKKDKSPLEKQIHKIGIFVGKITLILSSVLFIIGYFLEKKDIIENFLFSASVAVAAVPEGLPATITIALALGVQKLAKKNAIIKQLTSVETLGSTTVICTDKTGTLTKNEMTVKEISIGSREIHVTGSGYNPEGHLNIIGQKDVVSIGEDIKSESDKILEKIKTSKPKLYTIIEKLCEVSALCSNAKLLSENEVWTCIGDATEGALLTVVEKCGFNGDHLKKEYKKLHEFPFDSLRKTMTTVHKAPDKKLYAFSKGAPEQLIKKCAYFLDDDGTISPLNKHKINLIEKNNKKMAQNALRVLALAYKIIKTEDSKLIKNQEEIEKDFIFIGLAGIIDPPRENVKDAVHLAKKAGIKIYMITGDQSLTAIAIAKQLDMIDSEKIHVVLGDELEKLDSLKLKEKFVQYKNLIFARANPEHKLKIVSALKELGEVVAVTGDGVNDAPALKRADIGISMGITGTDVSKEASNMVLADDSFSTIITAIKEGRTVYENLKKFIFYIFSSNIGELFVIFMSIVLFMPSPLTAILILCINLGTDVFPALALSVDPTEPNTMEKKPRDPQEKILNKEFIKRVFYIGIGMGILVMIGYTISLVVYGWQWGSDINKNSQMYLKASTTAFVLLVLIQMVNAYNSRSEKFSMFRIGFKGNIWLILAVILSIGALLFMVEVPFMQKFLKTTHLTIIEWAWISALSMGIFAIEEIRKNFPTARP